MTHDEMTDLIEETYTKVKELRETKGREYAGPQDTLADFKEVGFELGISPLRVWGVYVKKHQRAIDSAIKRGGVLSESLESRVIDVITYHYLLLGLLKDEEVPF